ncbi:MAG: acyl carrier protein [Gemmatimonadota bacterium]|jgi:acyl carrier protein|nr:acyl carrier protein [Gemmatimonadota bacterium]
MDEIIRTVKAYIIEEFLPGEKEDALSDSTPLITGGILDSISTVRLVSLLEERYGIEFQAHELSADYLNSVAAIASTVQAKLGARG